ncbi:swc3p [Saccharomyces arboricola H-6]|uniref:Swc3p n=1 Tax=Saccharomyces arboricola (strain H-6 / AS 2.3317 / CBS 10644) TaxID=1160507 RepID=J8LRS6_SACAR|nr:swc3p [Saccharomyces arboricola H-6]
MPAVLRTRSKEASLEHKPAPRTRARSKRDERGRGDDDDDDDDDDDEEESDGGYDEVGDDYDEHASRAKLANNRPFEIVAGLPASVEMPNYNSSLTHPQSIKNSGVLYDSLVCSRRTWIQGEMFDLYWRRPKRIINETTPTPTSTAMESSTSGGIPLIRDKMQKMCDCIMSGGPHTFKVRLFILKNDKIEQKWQEEQDSKKREKELKRKNEAEAKRLRMEERKKQQLQKKIAKEQKLQLQKENKAKQKLEQEALKLKKKEEMKRLKEQNKNKQSSPSSMHDPRMIMNLNLMAQEDPKLNTLMETVAKGLANNDQLEEFKKFIEVAKRRSLEENRITKRPPVTTACPPGPPKNKGVPEANRLNSITLVKSTKPTASEPEPEPEPQPQPKKDDGDKTGKKQSEEETSTKDSTQVTVKVEEGVIVENPQKKEDNPTVPKRKRRKNAIKEDKDMQLTAFQQKYVQGAEIILEYLEFTHSRYYLPKRSLVEFLEDTGEILISWIVIHNSKEIEKFKTKKLKSKFKANQTPQEGDIKQDPEPEKEPNFNPLFEDDCPTPLYTPMTMKLSGIHKRFNQIIRNSVFPMGEVVKDMEKILQIGTRLSGYNLWYQLDGYDDEALSESLRFELNEWEHTMRSKRHKR